MPCPGFGHSLPPSVNAEAKPCRMSSDFAKQGLLDQLIQRVFYPRLPKLLWEPLSRLCCSARKLGCHQGGLPEPTQPPCSRHGMEWDPAAGAPGPLPAFLMQITPVLICSQQIARESDIKGVPGEMSSRPRINPWDLMHPEIIHYTPSIPSCLIRSGQKACWEISAEKQQAEA